MNLRRTPPPSFTQPSQPQPSPPQSRSSQRQPRSTTSPSLLPQKAAASSSGPTTRRSPAGSPSSQTAQSLPSLRDHLHSYLPPVAPQERETAAPSSAAPTSSTAPPVFAGGYPFQPYGSTTSVASHPPPYPSHPGQSGLGYTYSHPPPPLPHGSSAPGYSYSQPQPQSYPSTSRGEESDDDEIMVGASSSRHRTYSTSGQPRSALGTEREAYERERADERGSGSGDLDVEGPPKKKRRRQALSCTECKRRKIKCDRSQPCAPCTRRGEQSKCQWHIVEPVEKYIPRHEFEELKLRVEYLESLVLRGPQGYPAYPGPPPNPPSSGYPAHQPSPAQSQSYPPPHPPPPPPAPQPQTQPHTAIPGVPGPAPAPPPTSGIHHLLSGAPPSPGQPRSPVLRLQRELDRERERDRELRHVRSSPIVGHAIPRERKESASISPLPPVLSDPSSSIPRRTAGHQHSLSSSSISSSSQGQGGSRGSPSLTTPTMKGRRRSGSPR